MQQRKLTSLFRDGTVCAQSFRSQAKFTSPWGCWRESTYPSCQSRERMPHGIFGFCVGRAYDGYSSQLPSHETSSRRISFSSYTHDGLCNCAADAGGHSNASRSSATNTCHSNANNSWARDTTTTNGGESATGGNGTSAYASGLFAGSLRHRALSPDDALRE